MNKLNLHILYLGVYLVTLVAFYVFNEGFDKNHNLNHIKPRSGENFIYYNDNRILLIDCYANNAYSIEFTDQNNNALKISVNESSKLVNISRIYKEKNETFAVFYNESGHEILRVPIGQNDR